MSDEKKSLRCSFCGKREEEVRRMIQAPGARICDQCIQLCMSVLEDELKTQSSSFEEAAPERLPTPKEIKEVLDAPDFDPEIALEQQIELLRLQKEHLEELIETQKKNMDLLRNYELTLLLEQVA